MNDKINSTLLIALSNRVKELRLEKGVTQIDASNDTGIHFGRIEQGRRDISFSTLNKLSEYFGLTMQEFLSSGFDNIQADNSKSE